MAAMRRTAFDTLATVRKLKAVGVDDAQAEAHAEAIASAVHSGRDDLATKADFAAVKTDLAAVKKADVRDNKAIKARIDALKGEIGDEIHAKWGIFFIGFLVGIGVTMAVGIGVMMAARHFGVS